MTSGRRDPKADALVAALGHPSEPAIQRLRDVILAAEPRLTEGVKWNAPSYAVGGEDRLTFRLNPPPALQIIFHRGARPKDQDFAFVDPTGLLTWAAPDRGVLTVDQAMDISGIEAPLADLVRRWIAATA